MTDGIIGTALNVFGEKEYPNHSRELRAMVTLLEKAADIVDENARSAEDIEAVAALKIEILEKERDELSKELEEWKEKYRKLCEQSKGE